mmetsp:Transcript_98178/g.282266  ORF Transcript_98178/g.282266 Transcript_98178/m.282266 type:complete len:100 (-) Transcript_98178:61-360(-)
MPVAVAAPASLRDWLTTCIGANVKTVNTCRTINNAEGVGGPSSEYNLRKQMSNVPYIAATSTSKEIEAPQDDEHFWMAHTGPPWLGQGDMLCGCGGSGT